MPRKNDLVFPVISPDLSDILKDAPYDKWIAISLKQRKIVGVGDSVMEACEQAKRNGEANPVIQKRLQPRGLYVAEFDS
jgi:hypothetical protein